MRWLTPDKAQQSEGLSPDANRCYKRGLSAQCCVEYQPDRKWKLRVSKRYRFAVADQVTNGLKCVDLKRFAVRIDHLQQTPRLLSFGGFELNQRDLFARLVE